MAEWTLHVLRHFKINPQQAKDAMKPNYVLQSDGQIQYSHNDVLKRQTTSLPGMHRRLTG
jgi:hypothetical protein